MTHFRHRMRVDLWEHLPTVNPEDRVKAYLTRNQSKLQYASSVDAVVGMVKSDVFYGYSTLPDDQVRKLVVTWAMVYAAGLLTRIGTDAPAPNTDPGDPPPTSSDFVDAIKKVITTAGAGVTIGNEGKNLNLKVTGLSANLKTADGGASLNISWGGTLKLQAEKGPVHFEGTIASDKWEISVTFPDDDTVPILDTLPNIFKEGEGAVRHIARVSAGLKDISEVRNISSQIKPDVAKVQSAVDAISGIASAPKEGGWSFGFKIGSPDPMPGQQGMPGGYQGMVVGTWVF